MQRELIEIIEDFPKAKITVIGDVMIDRYIKGRVRRISPEAPVPVIEVTDEKSSPGGAANVAANIRALGASCELISVVGEDKRADELINMMKGIGVEHSGIINLPEFRTIEKIRILAEHQQVARVDREEKLKLESAILEKIILSLEKSLSKKTDAVIFSDYGKGIFSQRSIEKFMDICDSRNIPVFVDPKVEHFQLYKGAECITPNTMEAFSGMRETVKYDQPSAQKLGEKILKKLSLKSLIITQSENGMTVFINGKNIKITHLDTRAREVFDVTGAGDTVISVLTVAFACSKDIEKSANIANYAAGIAVGKLGTVAITSQEIKEEIKLWGKQ